MDKIFQKLQAGLKVNYKAVKQHLLRKFPMGTTVDAASASASQMHTQTERLPRYREFLTSIPIACLWPGLLTVCNIFKTEREMKTNNTFHTIKVHLHHFLSGVKKKILITF